MKREGFPPLTAFAAPVDTTCARSLSVKQALHAAPPADQGSTLRRRVRPAVSGRSWLTVFEVIAVGKPQLTLEWLSPLLDRCNKFLRC